VEGYYKEMTGLIEYKPGASYLFGDGDWENKVYHGGKGNSYGAEFFVHKKKGKFNGWVGYTLSNTTRTFDDLDGGKTFPAKYDKTHDLSIVLMYKPHKKWKLNATFIYGTGQATTLPINYYFTGTDFHYQYGDRNSYRMPAYHRLDLGVNFVIIDIDDKYSAINLSVYNAYNRQNPYFLFNETEGDPQKGEPVVVKAYQTSLFPILPTISWNFKY